MRRSADDVYLSEGMGGVIEPCFITQVFRPYDGEILFTKEEGWFTSIEDRKERRRRREGRGTRPRGNRGKTGSQGAESQDKESEGGSESGDRRKKTGNHRDVGKEEDCEWSFGKTKREYRRKDETFKREKEENEIKKEELRRIKKKRGKKEGWGRGRTCGEGRGTYY